MKSEKRQSMNAPCGVDYWNKNERIFEREYPAVKCNYKCAGCGFNPAESKRRVESGWWEDHITTHILHSETGEVLDVLTKPVQTLRFRKETANAK